MGESSKMKAKVETQTRPASQCHIQLAPEHVHHGQGYARSSHARSLAKPKYWLDFRLHLSVRRSWYVRNRQHQFPRINAKHYHLVSESLPLLGHCASRPLRRPERVLAVLVLLRCVKLPSLDCPLKRHLLPLGRLEHQRALVWGVKRRRREQERVAVRGGDGGSGEGGARGHKIRGRSAERRQERGRVAYDPESKLMLKFLQFCGFYYQTLPGPAPVREGRVPWLSRPELGSLDEGGVRAGAARHLRGGQGRRKVGDRSDALVTTVGGVEKDGLAVVVLKVSEVEGGVGGSGNGRGSQEDGRGAGEGRGLAEDLRGRRGRGRGRGGRHDGRPNTEVKSDRKQIIFKVSGLSLLFGLNTV
jgi:hypothetical protein